MYLDFIKDIFQLHDYICVECGNEKTEGFIVKISSDLIAIKTSAGIVIKKDADITNVYSIDKTKEDTPKLVVEAEMPIDGNAIPQESSTEENQDIPSLKQDNDHGIVEEQALQASPITTTFQTSERDESKGEVYKTPKPKRKQTQQTILHQTHLNL